jgi:N-acetyl-gamma-glutamyl-phosphate/LysW-gamma-L-alpha-aminoadipyl-6-phosphate reductase
MKVNIVGGSGYSGGELLRILLRHPHVTVNQVTSHRYTGMPVTLLHPNLRGLTRLTFSSISDLKPCDVLFIALPNGESMRHMPAFMQKAGKIIDMGADFRLKNPDSWKIWYKSDHLQPQIMKEFVYGVPEIFREDIKGADFVAGPGCEAIVSILSLYPFIKNELIDPSRIIIDAKMGSSQTGSRSKPSTHHPERSGATRSYKPTGHRHAAEIEMVMDHFSPDIHADISATAIEMVRGILVTIHAKVADEINEKDIWRLLRSEYNECPFVRIVKEGRGLYRLPEPKILMGTNFCDIGFELDKRSRRLVIIGAIDNLVKGTAGNAVQCLNLMSGIAETTGLEFPGLHPV